MFQPQKLKNNYTDYAPFIDSEIMRLHYDGHYKGYINNLNAAIQKHPKYFDASIKDLLLNINSLPTEIRELVRNNGGGASNHELFWSILSTEKDVALPDLLEQAINKTFGSFENLKELMTKKLGTHFGSGWVWLVVNKDKKLDAYSLPNQDSPYMNGDTPIMGIDIWEHAYYLQYKNVRSDYLANVWRIIDWKKVAENYKNALV